MIFVSTALEEIGWEGLLFNLKANEFYNSKNLMREDYLKLFSILSNTNDQLVISEAMKDNLFLIILYWEIEESKEMKEIYSKKYLKTPIESLIKSGSKTEQIHFWYNLIEIDFKYRHRSISELKLINIELSKFSENENNFEEFLLMKYYRGVILFLMNQYDKCKKETMDIILDISERRFNDEDKNTLFKFIELKNSILAIKTIEMEDPVKNRQEILNNLECLFENVKSQNEDFAITIGIKMNSIQAGNLDYIACSKILDELLTLLHKEILFGKANSNLINQYLYTSAYYGYYQAFLGNNDQVIRSIKKISKSLYLVEEMSKVNSSQTLSNINNNLFVQYSFFNLVLKQNEKMTMDKAEQNKIITNYKAFLNKTLRERNEVLLNIYSINNFDNCAQYYMEKEKIYLQSFINKEKLYNNQLLLAYFYLYNSISSLSKSMITDYNTAKQSEYIKKIRNYAQLVIDYTIHSIDNNNSLKSLFQLNYFKELFNRIYFSNIYSFYHERKYNEVISKVDEYLNMIKFQFELGSGKSIYNIIQIKGDAMMKVNNFKGALDVYNSIIEHCPNKPLVNFKLGACNIMVNNVPKGKQYFQYSQQLYTNDKEKKISIENMMKKINI